MAIDHVYNYDDVFFRMVTVSLAKTLNKHITWIYYFENGKKCVNLPFYNSMAGQERFLLDAFIDDIPGTRVELNTDQIPRGVISLTSVSSSSDEFANPNVFIPKRVKVHDKLREIWSRVKAVPMTINYDVEIRLANERDVYVCMEKIMYLLFNYKFFRMDYFGVNIENVLLLPDDKTIEIPREFALEGNTRKTIKFPLTVRTYFPIWDVDTDKVECEDEVFETVKRIYWDVYIHELQDLSEDEMNSINNMNGEEIFDYTRTSTFDPFSGTTVLDI